MTADRGAGMERTARQTIADFGDQWSRYTDNSGYYGGVELFADMLGPLLPVTAFRDKTVAEIGSGTGRIVRMLVAAGAARVIAVEPSAAFEVLTRNVAEFGEKVRCVKLTGDELPGSADLDFVISIGVIHHITEPAPVMRAAYRALKPGGYVLLWLYGREGNERVVWIIELMRRVSPRLPHAALSVIAATMTALLAPYVLLCRVLPLPLRDYMLNVFGKFSQAKRYLVVYDQLNPAYAKYYSEAEARALVEDAGFVDARLHNRRGYSWTVLARRPPD